jgi:hypothetical protein
MLFNLPRIGIAALVALGLAACSGQSTVPSSAPQAFAPDAVSMAPLTMRATFGDTVLPNAASPCNVGIWYFKASCVAATIKSSPNKVALQAYETYALTLSFPKSNAKNAEFLLGLGTSSKDISGSFDGAKFPDYGTLPCITLKGKTTKCPGKAFLYLFIANASAGTVTFPSIPGASVTTTGAFPGAKSCSAILMHMNSATKPTPDAWILLPGSAKPVGKTVSVPGFPGGFGFPTYTFTVVGFICQ